MTSCSRPFLPSPWLLLPVGLAVALGVALFPGRWTPDTVAEFAQVRSGRFDDWYGPLFLATLRLPYLVVPHLGLLLPVQLVVLATALYGLGRALFSSRTSALLAAATMLFPPVLGWEIVLSRDVWYGTLLLGAAAALRVALFERRLAFGARVAAYAAACAAAVLAAGVRQNGIVGLIPLAALVSWHATAGRARERRRVPATALVTIGIVTVIAVGVRVLTYDVARAQRSRIQDTLYIYDLAAVSQRTGRNLFPARTVPDRSFLRLRRTFDPDNVDSILWGADAIVDIQARAQLTGLRSAWLDVLRDHPTQYARARLRLYARMLAVPPARPVWTYQPAAASVVFAAPLFARPSSAADRYLDNFEASFLERPALYLVIVVVLGVVALRRGGQSAVFGAACVGAAAYSLTFLPLTTVVGVRFSWILFVLGVLCGGDLARLLAERHHRRLLVPEKPVLHDAGRADRTRESP